MASKRKLDQQIDESLCKNAKTLAYEIHEACCTDMEAEKVERLIRSCNSEVIRKEIIKDLNARKTLHEVCTYDDVDILKSLLSLGLNINGLNRDGKSPLYVASEKKFVSVVEELLRQGSDPNIKCAILDRTPLHEVLDTSDLEFDEDDVDDNEHYIFNILKLIKSLVNHGADVNAQDCYGGTPLYMASMTGVIEIVRELLKNGAIVDTSALHNAVAFDQVEIVQEFINHNANLDTKDSEGNSPLHSASAYCCTEVVTLLLKNGANIEALDENGSTPLLVACLNGNTDIVNELLQSGANTDHPNNGDQYTPIHFAALYGHESIIIELLKYNPNIEAKCDLDETALHKAAREGHLKIVKLLLEHGANMNALNIIGETPLLVSMRSLPFVEEASFDVMETLLTRTDLNLRNHQGLGALDIAINLKHLKIAKLIAKRMCPVSKITNSIYPLKKFL